MVKKFGPFVGYLYAINTVIGAGFLSLPWAYDESGWLFCLLIQVLYALMNLILSFQFLAVLARIKFIETALHTNPFKKIQKLELNQELETGIQERRTDLNELTFILFGRSARVILTIMLSIKLWLAGTAYFIIFAEGFTSNVPFFGLPTWNIYETNGELNECRWVYTAYIVIFLFVMMYFTTRSLSEQLWMQMLMSFMRFLIMGLVIGTSIAAIASNTYIDSTDYNPAEIPELVDIRYAGDGVPVIAFASFFTMSLPTILEFMDNKRTVMLKLVVAVVFTTTIFYSLLGILVPIASKEVYSNTVLNYRNYSAGYDMDERPWWTYMLEYLIILFPAFDVASIFPILIILLSDNQLSMFYGSKSKEEYPVKIFYGFRIFAWLVPFGIAILYYDLGQINDFAGLQDFALIIALCFMHIVTRQLVPRKTDFDIAEHPGFSWFFVVINFVGFWAVLSAKLIEVETL